MQSTRRSEVALLRDVVALFHEVALFLATGDSPIAQQARLRLEARGPDEGAFLSNLSCDLEELGSTLKDIPDTFTDKDGEVNAGVKKVLSVVQSDYLDAGRQVGILDDSEDSVSDDEGEHQDPYRPLQTLLKELRDLKFKTRQDEKMIWLCGEVKLAKTKSKHRRTLLQAVKNCTQLLRPYGSAQPVDVSWRHDDKEIMIWDTPIFTDAEKLHKILVDIWKCNCFDGHLHQHAMFSFEGTAVAKHSCSAGRLYYKTELQNAYGWKHTRFEFAEHDSPSERLTVPEKIQLRATNSVKAAPGIFCDNLEHWHEGDVVQITNAASRLHRGPTSRRSETAFSEHLPLTACFELPSTHSVYALSPKRRMMLALYLAYAYLHLSGGAWWPYSRRTSVRLPDRIDPEAPPSAFFAASLIKGSAATEDLEFDLVEKLNRDMPSLIAFGRLLLELYLGRQVIWDHVKPELKKCADHPFAIEMTAVIEYCLKPSESRASTQPYTIRDDEMLRQSFIRNVVLPIQYILQYGYQVKAQDVFTTPQGPKISELAMPRRLRSLSPLVSATGAQIVPAGFCLHDGDDTLSKIEDNSARDARSYMDQLTECSRRALSNDLCPPMHEDSSEPVRVAVLDTGAHITTERCEHIYDGRIRECRTWLTTSDAKGEAFEIGTSDSDGHGTHGASVLLEATQSSNTAVYVAQIFEGRNQKIVKDEFIDDTTVTRIVNAINHAVKVWKVDIISMSFGFPKRINEIDKALKLAATRGVLMLAAASNCGGNDRRSWPARDPKVLCIYASDGLGNMYPRNPTALTNKDNFAVLGSCVEGAWPGQDELVRKSGTSTATPICAAISALVMTAMRRSQEKYVAAAGAQGRDAETLQDDYEAKLEQLGQASAMSNVLRLMLGEGKRGDYDYVTPWTLFQKDRSAMSIIESILEVID